MGEKDISRVLIGKHPVSIIGLKEAISVLSESHGGRSDDEVASAMMIELEKENYIPASAKENYKAAFVREFRKALGQPYTEERTEGLDIKVLGAGCNQCDKLEALVMEVLIELNIPAGLEHVREMRDIARYGVMGVPALVINGKVVSTGTVPPREKLKIFILEASKKATAK